MTLQKHPSGNSWLGFLYRTIVDVTCIGDSIAFMDEGGKVLAWGRLLEDIGQVS